MAVEVQPLERGPQVMTVGAAGEIDMRLQGLFRTAHSLLLEPHGQHLVLDFSEVAYHDSSASGPHPKSPLPRYDERVMPARASIALGTPSSLHAEYLMPLRSA